MGLTINNNVASLTAQNNLGKTNSMLSSSLEKLSTGLKVNRGADGPAALVISEKQRAQISGLRTALDNTNKAVSLVQTGEGAMNEMNRLLNKARSLALDSANAGVNDRNAFDANQAELKNILGTIDDISNRTEFNGKKLLDGSAQGVTADNADFSASVTQGKQPVAGDYNVTVTQLAATASYTGTAYGAAGAITAADGEQIEVGFNGGASKAVVTLEDGDLVGDVAKKLNDAFKSGGANLTASVDSGTLKIESTEAGSAGNFSVVASAATEAVGLTADDTTSVTSAADGTEGLDVEATVTGPNGGAVSATGKGNTLTLDDGTDGEGLSVTAGAGVAVNDTVKLTASTALVFQTGANAGDTASVTIDKMSSDSIGKGKDAVVDSLSKVDISNGANAQTALKVIDQAISDVANQRAKLGAFQANNLESNANNLRTSLENTVAAESVIRDTDFAQEIANFTKLQTQMQAGSTVLGNANQMTQLVAGLLR